mmetsp:Transcript_9139/g.26677  ORF Transcript_9139/g.26677 Transcript_9139/m.26677 type:complete len:309 (+) Transcript_9139:454-1380(+)
MRGTSAAAVSRLWGCFSPASLPARALMSAEPLARSRGPSSRRSGTPLRSHSKNFGPGRSQSRSSTCTRTPSACNSALSLSTAAVTAAASSVPGLPTGTMTTCVGATFGGSTRPLSSACVMTSAPMSRVLTPQLVAQTISRLPSLFWNCTSKALAKFWPRKCEVPLCSAQPFCMSASMVYVSTAPAKRSDGLLAPGVSGTASRFSTTSAYTSSISRAVASASSAVACAVWPSCQRNSALRRNGRVRISQRTTLAHWLSFSGRSRCELIHWPNMCQIMVSEVGRTMRGSSSSASGSGTIFVLPGSSALRR